MYLVTGGAGFIGSHVLDLLRELKIPFRVLDDLSNSCAQIDPEHLVQGSVTDEAKVLQAAAGCRAIIHLAARVSVPESAQHPMLYTRTNILGTATVLEAARALGIPRVVFASSCSVYGDQGSDPIPESAPLRPTSFYAASKLAGEHLCAAFSTAQLSCVALRFFNVYGPRQRPGGPYAAAVPAFLTAACRGETIRIFGDGRQTRDLVHVTDVARSLLRAAEHHDPPPICNVGRGVEVTVQRVANVCVELATQAGLPRSNIILAPERVGDIRRSLADPRLAIGSGIMDDMQELGFDEGMTSTFAWYKSAGETP